MKLIRKIRKLLRIDHENHINAICPCCSRKVSSNKIMINDVARCFKCGAFFNFRIAKKVNEDNNISEARKRVFERRKNMKKNWGHDHNVRK